MYQEFIPELCKEMYLPWNSRGTGDATQDVHRCKALRQTITTVRTSFKYDIIHNKDSL